MPESLFRNDYWYNHNFEKDQTFIFLVCFQKQLMCNSVYILRIKSGVSSVKTQFYWKRGCVSETTWKCFSAMIDTIVTLILQKISFCKCDFIKCYVLCGEPVLIWWYITISSRRVTAICTETKWEVPGPVFHLIILGSRLPGSRSHISGMP